MKIVELLKEETVTLAVGSHLVGFTRSEGYVPTLKDTSSVHKGRYLYRVVGASEADPVTGEFDSLMVVPLIHKEDLSGFREDLKNPIIVQKPGKIQYMSGRNAPIYKDVYHDRLSHEDREVVAGQEHRAILAAFVEFIKTEFGIAVNDFRLESPSYFEGDVPPTQPHDVLDGTGEGASTEPKATYDGTEGGKLI